MISVELVVAMSADGFIARHSHELVDWTSKEDRRRFTQITRQVGVVIMGANTYRTLRQGLPGRRVIVYSHVLQDSSVEVTREPPRLLLARLEREGIARVVIFGGSSIYSLFLQEKLVQRVFLTIEPILLGHGISLSTCFMEQRLCLEEVEESPQGTIFLQYQVLGSLGA